MVGVELTVRQELVCHDVVSGAVIVGRVAGYRLGSGVASIIYVGVVDDALIGVDEGALEVDLVRRGLVDRVAESIVVLFGPICATPPQRSTRRIEPSKLVHHKYI